MRLEKVKAEGFSLALSHHITGFLSLLTILEIGYKKKKPQILQESNSCKQFIKISKINFNEFILFFMCSQLGKNKLTSNGHTLPTS